MILITPRQKTQYLEKSSLRRKNGQEVWINFVFIALLIWCDWSNAYIYNIPIMFLFSLYNTVYDNACIHEWCLMFTKMPVFLYIFSSTIIFIYFNLGINWITLTLQQPTSV